MQGWPPSRIPEDTNLQELRVANSGEVLEDQGFWETEVWQWGGGACSGPQRTRSQTGVGPVCSGSIQSFIHLFTDPFRTSLLSTYFMPGQCWLLGGIRDGGGRGAWSLLVDEGSHPAWRCGGEEKVGGVGGAPVLEWELFCTWQSAFRIFMK